VGRRLVNVQEEAEYARAGSGETRGPLQQQVVTETSHFHDEQEVAML